VTREELSERLWNFAARVGKVVDALPDSRLGRHVAGQLVRCGTAAAPNYDEGCNAESRADFVHKLKLALKELAETRGWLSFIARADLLPPEKLNPLIDECQQLCRILGRSVTTAKYPDLESSPKSLRDESITNYQLPIANYQSADNAHDVHSLPWESAPFPKLGIFAKTFARPTIEETLDAVVGRGLTCIQFNYSCAGLPILPEEISPELARRIGEAVRTRSLEMAAVSGTFNMIHPQADKLENGFRGLSTIAATCSHIGTRIITLCTGTRDASDMWRAHPENDSKEAWRDLLVAMERCVEIAERFDVLLGIEPELANVINSAAKARRLLDEMKSPRLKIVMDGANLLHPTDLPRAGAIWEEAFDLLANEMVIAHAKDLTANGQFVAAGKGVLDYDLYLTLLHSVNFDGPLILHGLAEDDVQGSVQFLRTVPMSKGGC
jgi:four helix bundle protein